MTGTRHPYPAERDDYCPSCGTAPCSHPRPPVTLWGVVVADRHDDTLRPLLRDLATLAGVTVLGWLLVVVLAAKLGPLT